MPDQPTDVAMRLAVALQHRGLISRVLVATGGTGAMPRDALAPEPDARAIAAALTLDEAGVGEAYAYLRKIAEHAPDTGMRLGARAALGQFRGAPLPNCGEGRRETK